MYLRCTRQVYLTVSLCRPSFVAHLCSNVHSKGTHLSCIHIELHILVHLMAIGGEQDITRTHTHTRWHKHPSISYSPIYSYTYVQYVYSIEYMQYAPRIEQLWKYVCVRIWRYEMQQHRRRPHCNLPLQRYRQSTI